MKEKILGNMELNNNSNISPYSSQKKILTLKCVAERQTELPQKIETNPLIKNCNNQY